jgi:dihydroorotase
VSAPARLIGGPRTPADLLLRDVHVLDPRTAIDARHDVLIRDGLIAELAAPGALALSQDGDAPGIDGAGRLRLLPAFFDPHVHLRTPGQEHKESIDSGTRAAAAGGFCAVIAMPNTDPVLDSAPLLRSLRDAAAREARVPVGFLPAITRGLQGEQLSEMAELRGEGALGFTDDGRPVASAGMLRKALQYQRLCGGVLSLHEEDPTLSRGGAMHEGAVSAALGIAGIPSVAESTMVARDAALAGYDDARVHFQHLSCAASVDALAGAKARGYRVSGEVCPHHLLLTEEDVRTLDTRMKMYPPLATEADRLALVQGLRDGTIDCIATDHAPHARDEKEVPFEQAPMGSTGLETAFAALYTGLVETGALTLELLVRRMTAGAELFELPTPTIAVGQPANLTLVDLDATWVAGEHGWQSRSENCCFAGRALKGRVLLTLAAGAIAHRDRALPSFPQSTPVSSREGQGQGDAEMVEAGG